MKPPRPSNFEYLDPEAPRTKRIIEAALTVNVPLHPDQGPVFEPSKIAVLHQPPVTSPIEAVRAAIVAERRGQK